MEQPPQQPNGGAAVPPQQQQPQPPQQQQQQMPPSPSQMPQNFVMSMPRGPYMSAPMYAMPPQGYISSGMPYGAPGMMMPGGYAPRGIPMQYAPPAMYARGPMPGQPAYVPRGPQAQPGVMAPSMPAAQASSSTPYVKREKKPLIIVDPKTLTAVEIKPVAPVVKPASAAPSPALGPVSTPVVEASQTPIQRPSAAEEMRLKALAAKTGASPAAAMNQVQNKMEGLRLDAMPEMKLPTSKNEQMAPPQSHSASIVPKSVAAEPQSSILPAKVEQQPVNVAPPLAFDQQQTTAPGLSTEERKARAKREMDEKMARKQEYEQKVKDDEARREAETSRSGPSLSNIVEAKPEISLPLPTPVVAPVASPTSRSGERLVYSRDDLSEFRNKDICMQRPDDLLVDFQEYQPRPKSARPTSRQGAGGPPRVGPSGAPPQVSDWRGPKGSAPPGSSGGAAAPAVPPLKVSQNAWKRTQPTSENEATLRSIRSILNRLARDNFDALSKEVLAIPITSLTMLEDVIKAIFDKALMEPPFGPVYAQLCKEISDKSGGEWDFVRAYKRDGGWFWSSTLDVNQENALNGPNPENPDEGYPTEKDAMEAAKKQTGFKRILLNKCQQEFEKNSFDEVNEEERELREKMDMNTDEARQKLQAIEAARRAIKKRVLGNVAFIGELYLKKMLSAKIINTCIVQLLGEEAVTNPERFFEGDKKNEVPAEDIECLCKLFQTIGKEMDQGEYTKYVDSYFKFLILLEQSMGKSDKAEHRVSRQRFMIKDLIDLRKARWVDKRESQKAPSRDEVRAKTMEQEAARSTQQSGGRGGPAYGGASGGASARSQQPSARFQQGATTTATSSRAGPQSSRFAQSATSTAPKTGPVMPGRMAGTPPMVVGAAVRPAGPPSVSTPPPAASTTPTPAAKKPNGSGETISDDKLKTSYASALEEYVVNGNGVEIATEFKSLFERSEPSKARKLLVALMVDRLIEKKEDERKAIIKLLPLLIKDLAVLPAQDVVEALQDSLEFLNDIMIDSPKAGQHIGLLLATCLQTGALTSEQIDQAMSKLKQESPEGAEQLASDLAAAKSKIGGIATENGSSSETGGWTDEFSALVRAGKTDAELVQFLSRCPQSEVAQRGPELVPIVFEFVVRKVSAIQVPLAHLEAEVASAMQNTLRRLVQNGPKQNEFQERALDELVTLVKRNGHPKGAVSRLFDALYQNDIVFEDALNAWRTHATLDDAELAEKFFKELSEMAQAENGD